MKNVRREKRALGEDESEERENMFKMKEK